MVEADHTLAGRRDAAGAPSAPAYVAPQENLMLEVTRPMLRMQAEMLGAWATCVTYLARSYAQAVESIAKQAQDIVRQ